MKAWMIIAGIALILLLLGFVRIRLYFAFLRSGLKLRLSIGFLRFRLLPERPKAEKKRKKQPKPGKEPKEKQPKEPSEAFALAKGDLPDIIHRAGKLLRRLKRLFRIDKLEFCLTPGGGDAAQIALRYGLCNAVAAIIIPALERSLRVKRQRYEIRLNYDQETPVCRAVVSVSVSIGGVFLFTCAAAFQLLGFLIRHKQRASAVSQS